MTKYNGHKNWNHWNVSLWINNDEGLYRMAQDCVMAADTLDEAASMMLHDLDTGEDTLKTPDGAPYTFSSIRAALVGFKG